MRGQFFVIATVVMIYTLVLVVQYIYDFSDIKLTQLEEMGELYYIDYIKEALNNTVSSSYSSSYDCSKLNSDINTTKKFLEEEMIKKGVNLTILYNVQSCPDVNFNFSIKTSNLATITEFSYLYAMDTTPPLITFSSPENKTYCANYTDLNFTINEPTSWIGYSLNGKPNVTITGNIMLYCPGFNNGPHNTIVYANDTSNNMNSSQVFFTIKVLGDVNNDGIIDDADLWYYDTNNPNSCYGTWPGDPLWNPKCDLNCNNPIDSRDTAIITRNFGKNCE